MEEKLLVSVVIPTYNRPIYLKRCIQSVLKQTYHNIEIIVVDDNNPGTQARSETEILMLEFQQNIQIKYLQHEKNSNGSVARNTGWKVSKGQYITFLDDDDIIEETKIEKQVKCLEALDYTWGACYTGYRLIKEHGTNQISKEKRSGNCYIDALMRTMFMGSGSNLLLRRKVVDEIDGYDESFVRNQDIEFLVRAMEKYKLAYVDEHLLTIYQEGVRKTRTFDEIDGFALYYLSRFEENINELNKHEKKRVLTVISLERFRCAVNKKEYAAGIKILKENNVTYKYIIKYIQYLIIRKLTHMSYGFNGK